MKKTNKRAGSQKGFTLIELSIVLVIIGLIVGGVLVGQDLIKAAELRATISQLEKYNTAVNTFRLKYNGIPGDLLTPSTFFSGTTTDGTNGAADGDGLVEDISASATRCTTEICIAGEVNLFWWQLSTAGLISEGTTGAEAADATDFTVTPGDTIMPAAKVGTGRILVGERAGTNYYLLTNPGTTESVAGGVVHTAALTPSEAYQIDTKLDDGNGENGQVLGIASATPDPSTADSESCWIAASGAYALSTAMADQLGCNLSFKANF